MACRNAALIEARQNPSARKARLQTGNGTLEAGTLSGIIEHGDVAIDDVPPWSVVEMALPRALSACSARFSPTRFARASGPITQRMASSSLPGPA